MQKSLSSAWILCGILLLAFALRVCPLENLPSESIEFVEGRMMSDAAWPLSQIASEIPPDQAPMKYYLLHMLLYSERSEFLLRFPALVFDLASILLVFYLGSLLFDKKAALLACFLMAVSMWNIHHATLARSYPLYAFSALASTIFLYRATQGQRLRAWIFYALALAFSFYSFYPSLFVLVAQVCWFFACQGWRKAQVKRLLLSLGLFFAMAAPILLHAASAFRYRANFGNGLWGLQGYAQISQAILEHFGGMKGPLPWGIFVFFLGFIWVYFFQKKRSQALLLLLLVVVPTLLYVACFYIFRMCIVPRLFFHTYPFFLLLAAAGIMSWRHRALRLAGVIVFMLPLFLYVFHQRGIIKGTFSPSDYERQRLNLSAVASAIKEQYKSVPLDYVAVAPWPSLFFIQYYLDKANKSPVERYLRNSDKELYTACTGPDVPIYGVDSHLSMLKELAAAGRLLVVDIVSGNLSKLRGGAETVLWLKASAYRTEQKAGADFYFISPLANASTDYRKSSEIARQKLFLESRIAGQSSFWDKRGPGD